MNPRITAITISVEDLERSVKFYTEGLGLRTEDIVGREFAYGSVAFFDMQPGLRLVLWPRKNLAQDAGTSISAPSPTEFPLGHNVSSKRKSMQSCHAPGQQAPSSLNLPP